LFYFIYNCVNTLLTIGIIIMSLTLSFLADRIKALEEAWPVSLGQHQTLWGRIQEAKDLYTAAQAAASAVETVVSDVESAVNPSAANDAAATTQPVA
jgi:hypothetical protein